MAASGAERRPRRGPAPIASFDHDVSDESSPENKQAIRLPEIREDPANSSTSIAATTSACGSSLAPPEQRARSHSSPAVHSAVAVPSTLGLQTPAAPRIDISRASSSSQQDSRDSSPELALFTGGGGGEDARTRLELGFREDGAADLRSSTEELAFLEGAPGGGDVRAAPSAPPSRRHSRKDSQSSEAALLAVSGRTSRLSSVGSQCSAHSAVSGFSHASHISRLSVVSGTSRSPSPHKMLVETSFCGPKPIETDPEICTAAVEERLLEIAKLTGKTGSIIPDAPIIPIPQIVHLPCAPPVSVDARDHREVRTEVTVENTRPASAPRLTSPNAPCTTPTPSTTSLDDEKRLKESRNRAKVEERRARSRDRREPAQPEVYRHGNRSKDIIRIKLKPDDEYDDDEDGESERTLISGEPARKPVTLELNDRPARPVEPVSPRLTPRQLSRTPSPTNVPVSRKSSFCSLFKSRETIASPDSPSDVLRRKKSLNEGRSRSKSRDRSTTPTSTGKMKGSVLSLFKTSRKSTASPSPLSRDVSPVVQPQQQFPQPPVDRSRGEKLKYYEDAKDGVIHIPLHTPPDELDSKETGNERREPLRESIRPASAPQSRAIVERTNIVPSVTPAPVAKPTKRTVLPDGSIIIPLHSPTEKTASVELTSTAELTNETVVPIKKIEKEPSPEKVINNTLENTPIGPVDLSFSADIVPVTIANDRPKRKERLIFTTHVGSKEQVFSTQFSITKTPSVTSEISESIPSFPESEEIRIVEQPLPDTSFFNCEVEQCAEPEANEEMIGEIGNDQNTREIGASPPLDRRDSSESEASSEAAATQGGSDAERRGLVVQESFEELPYVPTTLPMERSLALPMVPIRDRSGVYVAAVERPRATRSAGGTFGALTPPSVPTPSSTPAEAGGERLHIRLPRRARASSTASASAPVVPPRCERARSRSGGDASGMEAQTKAEWIDFSEVPERRKLPKRIQTLPATTRESVVFNYVPPERCQCECHTNEHEHTAPDVPAAPSTTRDDDRPLLRTRQLAISSSSLEYEEDGGHVQVNVHIAPFTADFDLHHNHTDSTMPQ